MLFQTPQERVALAQAQLEVEFDHAWVTYLLKSLGCPLNIPITSKAQCNLPEELDLRSRGRARELAKKVFGLVEP